MKKSEFYENLFQLKYDIGLCQEIDCSEEENRMYLEMLKQKKELPSGIIRRVESNGAKLNQFYRVVPLEITPEEMQEYCALKQTKNIQIIKNCVVFFTVLSVLSLIAGILLFFTMGI